MARAPRQKVDEKKLTKGELRKLNALRKSLVDEDIALDAFAKWHKKYGASQKHADDRNAQLIKEALEILRNRENLRIRRGGYLVTSGPRGVSVTPAAK